MNKPPNIAITGVVAVLAFSAILVARFVTAPPPPTPWRTDEAAAFEEARREGKYVMIDFTEDWSVPSVEMTANLDDLRHELDEHYIPLRIDLTNPDERTDRIRARYGVTTTPQVVFVGGYGTVRGRITQYSDQRTVRAAALEAAR